MSIISSETLKKLKCCECDCYLSRAPIYLKQNGTSVCSRCFTPGRVYETENLYRNVQLEDILKTYKFPCMFENEGCEDQLPFSDVEHHEKFCKFQPMKCLISSFESCDWFGTGVTIYDHYVDKHPKQVLQQHPFVFYHDVMKDSIQSYIAKLCGIVFLIHIKVCSTTHKIYHCVQWISGNLRRDKSKFTLTIERNGQKILRTDDIVPYNQTIFKQDASDVFEINRLIEVLGGVNNTVFTIDLGDFLLIGKCIKCGLNETALNENICCSKCAEKKYLLCKNASKGCKFSDTDSNVLFVHEIYLCLYNNKNKCLQCNNYLDYSTMNALLVHMQRKHKSNWIRQENEYDAYFFPFFCRECNSEISYVIDSCRNGKFVFIRNMGTYKCRMLSLDGTNQLSGLKCSFFFKSTANGQVIEKIFHNYEDVIEVSGTDYDNSFVKVYFWRE